ncbi:CDC48 family AAA ATPase [Fervidicoccus fontis]|uniref:AAA family ATPase, CDC48 subfamily n=1 Tax=Fervidicoccus fontis (strain DSM 19380 / JCM 18336 / VKM B-2539 / Kam940) TaxID=1163730 RepID=I0A2E7_FERFK|nr:CDC48 family AAA ATPase [Fervidicoccus fontis]AFH43154.1 AAA family ATPase, CDC48 subfamily [Fervidicoccus fontis Kam940]
MSEEVRAIVAEAKSRDVGKKRARVSFRLMSKLGVTSGDFIEIEGRKGTTLVQVWPAYPEDEDKDYIRIDGVIRNAIGVSVGETVTIRKAEASPATKIVLAPTGIEGKLSKDYVEYFENLLKEELSGKPLKRGETIIVPLSFFGSELTFVVTNTQPTTNVFVTSSTEIQVREEPVKEGEIVGEIPKVTWEDIGDLEEAKRRLREIVELPMRQPQLFRHLGIEPPKGVLLYGPPGTGKTLLAKALANEIGAYFVAINGPEIMSKFYGESEQRLREIFQQAQENAPAIIFIDEIDSIAPKREEVTGEVERRVVAQLLTLMDGLKERGRVVVIGATNRPDALDPALRRPGRFDREIEIAPPDVKARKEILMVHTRNVPLAEDVDLDKLAAITHGFTGADLAALVKEAAMNTIRRFIEEKKVDLDKPIKPELLKDVKVTWSDFMNALKDVNPSLIREIYVEVPNVKWSDIGGLEEAKQQLREAVEWPLKYPEIYEKMGVRPPRGVLLFGPPGTGKTMLAKAVATESEANFIAVRGPEVLSKWVGESEKAIREIFRRARQVAPTVIFFDEIDSITPARGLRYDSSGVTDRIVNQLLTEIDGIQPLSNVVVIGATNRPDILDPALLRPGRFDRLVYIPPPDKKSRLDILKIHTRKVPLASDVDLEKLADMTEGYTGADLEALVREAVMLALREKLEARPVEFKYFLKAMETVGPSLTREEVEKYERLAKQLKKMTI